MSQPNFIYLLGPLSLSGWENKELRYSLRSIEHVFRPAWVGITGPELPPFAQGIYLVPVTLEAGSRYKNMQRQLLAACRDPNVPEDLILMNDDFIVRGTPTWDWARTTLGPIKETEEKGNGWVRSIIRTGNWCRANGVKHPLNFEGHTPMPFQKKLMEPILEKLIAVPASMQLRTAYGNIVGGESRPHGNAKHRTPAQWPADSPFLSLKPKPSDEMKALVAGMYPAKCKWEAP